MTVKKKLRPKALQAARQLRRLRASNPNHDPDNGQFSSGDGGSGGGDKDKGGGSGKAYKPNLGERAALLYYTGLGHAEINGALRRDEKPNIAVRLAMHALDNAVANSKLVTDLTVYRGSRGALDERLRTMQPGEMVEDKGFVSTSRIYEFAKAFAGGTVMEIALQKGQSAIDVSPYSLSSKEQEILLPRGTKLRYVGRGEKGTGSYRTYQFEVDGAGKGISGMRLKGSMIARVLRVLTGTTADEPPPGNEEPNWEKFIDEGDGLIIHKLDGTTETLSAPKAE